MSEFQWVQCITKTCYIDKHAMPYIITGIMYRSPILEPQVEVSYFNDAEPKSSWVEGWRISF